MTGIINQLKKLDEILICISNQKDHSISDVNLINANLFDPERIIYLEEEGLIKSTPIPIYYRLTQKGIVFISGGGYLSESRRKSIDRRSNLIYLLSSPLLAFISLLISVAALYFSLSINKGKAEQPLNYSSNIEFSISGKKDTVIIYKERIKCNQQKIDTAK